LIQACTLVNVKSLKNDLVPVAAKAFEPRANNEVKRICIQMFIRVIQSEVPNPDKQEYLELFFPRIIDQLKISEDAPLELTTECLIALQKLTEYYPSILLTPKTT
jgi:hypothetical protein